MMKISDISVGTRHRKDLGDVEGLAQSIEAVGLLQPVVVNAAGELIAGERRIAAMKLLGKKEIPVVVAKGLDELIDALKAERDENTQRKPFTPSEAVALAEQLEKIERPKADARKKAGRPSVNLTDGSLGETRAKVAGLVGLGATSLGKASAVVEAADEHPKDYADLREQMDRTGKVSPAYEELVRRQTEDGKPKTRTPFTVPDVDSPPIPSGPSPKQQAQDRVDRIAHRFLYVIQGGINSFTDEFMVELRAQASAREIRAIASEARRIADDLGVLASSLEVPSVKAAI